MSRPLPKYLASREFVMSVIEDMRTAWAAQGYVLDMNHWAWRDSEDDVCHVCAGGSAVVFGLGGPMDEDKWDVEQWHVAKWCDAIRTGDLRLCDYIGHPIPEAARAAWCSAMEWPVMPDFFPAWERFANALPTLAEIEEAKR